MGEAATAADVHVITGDTKVVERGTCDAMYIVTTGIGLVAEGIALPPQRVRPGDKVLLSGTIGDHGIAILGVATVLNEIALAAEVGIVLEESRVPVRPEVVGAGEILGIDPLYVANEGKLVAFVAADYADAALAALRALPAGADAAIVGEVRAEPPGRVLGRTSFGGHRLIDMLVGDPLPRIC